MIENQPSAQEPQKEPVLPIIETYIGKERADEVIKMVNKLLLNNSELQIKQLEFQTQQLEFQTQQLEVQRLEHENRLKLAQIAQETRREDHAFFTAFDRRAKYFALAALVIIFIALFVFYKEGALPAGFTAALFGVVSSIVAIGGFTFITDLIKRNQKS